jgi:hypothetical protein
VSQADFNASAGSRFSYWSAVAVGDNPNGPGVACPWPLNTRQQFDVLRTAVGSGPTADRIVGLQILVQQWPEDVVSVLSYAIPRERDANLRTLELHVLALYRDPATADVFRGRLTDSDPDVRAAAADGLGILYGPTFQIPVGADSVSLLRLPSNPPIYIGKLAARWNTDTMTLKDFGATGLLATPAIDPIPFPQSTRDALESKMGGADCGRCRAVG